MRWIDYETWVCRPCNKSVQITYRFNMEKLNDLIKWSRKIQLENN